MRARVLTIAVMCELNQHNSLQTSECAVLQSPFVHEIVKSRGLRSKTKNELTDGRCTSIYPDTQNNLETHAKQRADTLPKHCSLFQQQSQRIRLCKLVGVQKINIHTKLVRYLPASGALFEICHPSAWTISPTFFEKKPALARCAPNGLDATRHMKQQLLQYSTGTKTRCVVTPNQQRCSPNAHKDTTEKDVAAEVPIRLPILCTTSLQTVTYALLNKIRTTQAI